MNFFEVINKRRSYRGKYQAVKVPREDLKKIMEAGLAAPSGCNKQTTSLICVDDPEVLDKIHAVVTPPVAETAPMTMSLCAFSLSVSLRVSPSAPRKRASKSARGLIRLEGKRHGRNKNDFMWRS
ncbi:hypothetical protein D6856_02800 [Butyrivibrio sp. XB500-5]|uniref:nitroreductase family protein n=1 Tax=Butyrivibrio sp. XB500-5 TaxID=2364880 RepID=UPI000EA9C974|nr:nitroreductase family protein [Butyrivibrio sp. XB500-5]RKM63065.1 hypothetical protein D6856_02800 [Butyrivibrio sp. XB500-5]